jgi:hypothetical protein
MQSIASALNDLVIGMASFQPKEDNEGSGNSKPSSRGGHLSVLPVK